MTSKTFCALLALTTCLTPLFAQIGQEERVEISIDELTDDFAVAPVGEFGLVVFGETDDEAKNKQTKWRFYKYDTDFKKVSGKSINIEKRYVNRGHFFQDTTLYLLFTDVRRSDEYKLIKINAATFETKSIVGGMPKKLNIEKFKVHDNYLYVQGSTLRDGIIGYANLKNKVLRDVPIEYKGENTIQSIDIDHARGLALYTITNYRRNDGLAYIQSFRRGKLVDELKVDPQGDNNLVSARASTIGQNEKIVVGTYARTRQGATGMYIAKLSGDNQEFIKYHHFGDFTNFFNYLPARQQVKLERKKERKAERGKQLNLKYNLLTHDIIQRGDSYILIAEAYLKTYRTQRRWETIYRYGRYYRVLREKKIFDGYRYTHGVVAAFDAEGKRLWDNTFEMGDFKSFDLKERITVNTDGEAIEMAYGADDRIRSKVILGNQVVDSKGEAIIKTKYRDEKIKASKLTNLEYWYDDYFVIWGYQKIKEKKDRNRDGKRKRKVFYFNKLAVK